MKITQGISLKFDDYNKNLLINISAQEIKKYVQKIRNQGEYVVTYEDGSFGVILHSELSELYTFEQRMDLLNNIHNSKHDLSSCSASDILCFILNFENYKSL